MGSLSKIPLSASAAWLSLAVRTAWPTARFSEPSVKKNKTKKTPPTVHPIALVWIPSSAFALWPRVPVTSHTKIASLHHCRSETYFPFHLALPECSTLSPLQRPKWRLSFTSGWNENKILTVIDLVLLMLRTASRKSLKIERSTDSEKAKNHGTFRSDEITL